MDALKNDLRLALRGLRRTPGFTAAAVLTLALGIGATTALFSVVDAVLLRPLGFGDESRLASLSVDFPQMHLQTFALSIAELKDLEGAPIFEHVGGYDPGTAALLTSGTAERVRTASATTGFFPSLGIQPVLGRAWTAEEDKKGARSGRLPCRRRRPRRRRLARERGACVSRVPHRAHGGAADGMTPIAS